MFKTIRRWRARRRDERALATLKETNTWLHDWISQGMESWSGESVNARNAVTVAEYYAACRNIAEDIGKLPIHVYRKLSPRGKRRLPDHPVQALLNRPNSEMTSMAFRETTIAHAMTWGKGLAEIVRDGRGRPGELWPLDPSRTEVKRDEAKRLIYIVWQEDGTYVTLQDRDVFHVHGLGYDGSTGYSIATLARQSLGLSLAQLRHGASLFKNGATPGGLIEYPSRFKDETALQRFLRIWNQYHGGAENTGKVAILEDGMKWASTAIPNTDAQWIESRGMSVEDVARWLRIPPHKIGHLDKATFSNIESQAREYVTDTLLSWETRFEQEVERKLIAENEPDVFAEHVNAALLKGETVQRFSAYATARQWGWLSANDIRDFENQDGIGEQGDVYLTPSNMVSAETLLEPPEPETPPGLPVPPDEDDDEEDDDQADDETMSMVRAGQVRDALKNRNGDRLTGLADVFRPVLADAYGRCLTVAGDRITRRANRVGAQQSDWGDWAETWFGQQRDRVGRTLCPIIRQFVAVTWAAIEPVGEVPGVMDLAANAHAWKVVDRYLADCVSDVRQWGATAPTVWCRESRAESNAAFEAAELVELLKGLFDGSANRN